MIAIDPTKPAKYRGVAFEFGEHMLIVPPLSMDDLEKYSKQLDKLTDGTKMAIGVIGKYLKENLVPLVWAALKRNYPDVTSEEISSGFITAENWGQFASALLGNSEQDKVRLGKELPAVLPGRKLVAAPPSASLTSIGEKSEAASPVELDGVGTISEPKSAGQ